MRPGVPALLAEKLEQTPHDKVVIQRCDARRAGQCDSRMVDEFKTRVCGNATRMLEVQRFHPLLLPHACAADMRAVETKSHSTNNVCSSYFRHSLCV